MIQSRSIPRVLSTKFGSAEESLEELNIIFFLVINCDARPDTHRSGSPHTEREHMHRHQRNGFGDSKRLDS